MNVLLLAARRAARARLVAVAAALATAVELDTVALAGDAVALACAASGGRALAAVVAERAGRAGRAAVRAAGQAGADGRRWGAGEVVVLLGEGRSGEAGGELLDGWCAVVGLQDESRRVGSDGLRGLDLGD